METIPYNAAGRGFDSTAYRSDSDQVEYNNASAVLNDDNYTFGSSHQFDIIKEDFSLNHSAVSPLEDAISAALIVANPEFSLESLCMSTLNTPEVRRDDAPLQWPSSAVFDDLVSDPFVTDTRPTDDVTTLTDVDMTSHEMMQMENLPYQTDFLHSNEIDEYLQQLEQQSVEDIQSVEYVVTDVQPMNELQGDSTHVKHDHDYCQDDDDTILSEFLELSSELATESSLELSDLAIDTTEKRSRRRELNNEACKRSRQRRKLTLVEQVAEKRRLEQANGDLRSKVKHLEKMRDEWKRRLLDMVAT